MLESTDAHDDYSDAVSVGPYAYSFKAFRAADLDVVRRDTTTGAETRLVLLADYTVAGVGNEDGGTITLKSALATGHVLTIRRSQARRQQTDLGDSGRSAASRTIFTRSAMESSARGLRGGLSVVASVSACRDNTAGADPKDYGCALDGSTDDSAAFQACIDANKGKRILVRNGTLLCAGITLSDSTYDDTGIVCDGGELKLKANAGASNFDGSIWAGLVITGASRVSLTLAWDGNRENQGTTREGVHCVVLAGADRTHIHSLTGRETAGDLLYIDKRSPLNPAIAPNSTNIVVDFLQARNSADAGRNACSVISCDGLTIGTLHSYQVGGIINGLQEPGGLDLEPNWPGQSITDVVIGEVDVVTAGSTGFAVQGVATTSDATRDWNIRRVTAHNVKVRCTSLGRPKITRVRDMGGNISNTVVGKRGQGAFVDAIDHCTLTLATRNTATSVYLGYSDFVNDSWITVDCQDYNVAGVVAIGINRSVVRGRVHGAVAGSTAIAIQTQSNGRALTQTEVKYEVDAPYDGHNGRAFYNVPGDTIIYGAGTYARNCDWSGYANEGSRITGTIPRFNVK